jgi:hypothetical protein
MGDKIAILEFNKHLYIFFFFKESGILPMIKTKMAYWQVLNLMHAWSLKIIVSASPTDYQNICQYSSI